MFEPSCTAAPSNIKIRSFQGLLHYLAVVNIHMNYLANAILGVCGPGNWDCRQTPLGSSKSIPIISIKVTHLTFTIASMVVSLQSNGVSMLTGKKKQPTKRLC